MWDPVWDTLTATRDVVRVDLRGYGESTEPPVGSWSARADVLETLEAVGIERAHLVGCSFGAGVCAEIALERPELVASLVLAAPGGALLTERTEQLAAAWELEGTAIEAGDLDAATDANVTAWVDGPHRGPDVVPADVRDAVRVMQRRVFDLTIDWPDEVWEADDELDPEAPERLGEIGVPTLVVSGALDIDSIGIAAELVAARVPGARHVEWPDVAHLPSMERPDDFAALVLEWVAQAEE
jgi:pimeloyl-ACP methyl ester carboxylesterase